jgi:hypothetical protein
LQGNRSGVVGGRGIIGVVVVVVFRWWWRELGTGGATCGLAQGREAGYTSRRRDKQDEVFAIENRSPAE